MSQTDIEQTATDPASDTLASMFPALFVERLIEPLFADRKRAKLATFLLRAPATFACTQLCQRPAVERKALLRSVADECVRSSQVRAQVIRLGDELARDGVRGVAIKGLATALSVYPEPAYRALPDVDMLYREQDLPRLAELLAARGFRSVTGGCQKRAWGALTEASFAPVVPPDRGFVLDVHRAVDEPPVGDGLGTEHIFAHAEELETEWGPIRVPAREHSFAIAALHAFRDFYGPEGLKGLFDACLIVNRFGERLDWGEVEAVARRGRFVKRMVFFRELLAALGAGEAPVFADRSLAPWLRPRLDAIARNYSTLDRLVTSDARKIVLEAALLDSPFATLRLHWRRLRSLVVPKMHYLPSVPIAEEGAGQ